MHRRPGKPTVPPDLGGTGAGARAGCCGGRGGCAVGPAVAHRIHRTRHFQSHVVVAAAVRHASVAVMASAQTQTAAVTVRLLRQGHGWVYRRNQTPTLMPAVMDERSRPPSVGKVVAIDRQQQPRVCRAQVPAELERGVQVSVEQRAAQERGRGRGRQKAQAHELLDAWLLQLVVVQVQAQAPVLARVVRSRPVVVASLLFCWCVACSNASNRYP